MINMDELDDGNRSARRKVKDGGSSSDGKNMSNSSTTGRGKSSSSNYLEPEQ